ncbi:MAG: DUF4157 domain-containing protein [Coleofasciculaceae cyanobacterium]
MYHQQIAKKTSPSLTSTPINQKTIPTPSYGSLSGTIQRATANPESLSRDEWRQLDGAIGTRATNEIKSGKRTSAVPEFKGISSQLWGDSGGNEASIQAKLTIGEVGDKYEQEADRVAAEVVQQISRPAPVSNAQGEVVQGKESKEEEGELQLKPMVQRRADAGGEASPDLTSAINSARGGGQPLDEGLQQSMGQAMGADFSGVRVHTNTQSDRLNQSIQAKAFTTGQDVFFQQGEYQPGSRGGQELIAHELTHVVQQNGEAVKTILQRTYDKERLNTTIKNVYSEKGKEAKEKDFVKALTKFVEESKESSEEIFGDPKFAWHLMQLVGEESGMKLQEKIKESSENKGKPIVYKNTPVFKARWTLRSYTESRENNNKKGKPFTPKYTELKSTAELLASGIIEKSAHTTDADWNKIGNVGFIFHLLCIDGKVPNRSFLSTSTHYAEFEFDSIPNLFVSGDMLGNTGKKSNHRPSGFKGSGADVKAALCNLTLDKSSSEKFLKGLDENFPNFEVKVPGQLNVAEWKAV